MTNKMIEKIYKECVQIAQINEAKQQMLAAKSLVHDYCQQSDWLDSSHFQVDAEQGWCLHPIFSTETEDFSAFILAWLPGCFAPPHTHGGWTVIGGMIGCEKNILWKRVDDGLREGYAQVEKLREINIGSQDILVMPSNNDIHSVENEGETVSITFHAYQKHPNRAERYVFNPIENTVQPFVTKTVETE